ncbi:MAG: type II toxin-antitoxin system RelE/ParE family toxin [Rhabdochlamydiaceae bacterium]
MREEALERPLMWVASSKNDLMDMPDDVRRDFGHGLYQAQIGKHPDIGKPMSGFGGANVVELIKDHKGDTFRAVYTVRFADVIAILHAFQKKSKKGKETPKSGHRIDSF